MRNIDITTLKLKNEQLRNEMRNEKEFAESFNKPSEAIKCFDRLMRSPTSNNDTTRLGYTSIVEGESSSEQRNKKGKNYKPTCHNCGKLGHIENVSRSNNAN